MMLQYLAVCLKLKMNHQYQIINVDLKGFNRIDIMQCVEGTYLVNMIQVPVFFFFLRYLSTDSTRISTTGVGLVLIREESQLKVSHSTDLLTHVR